jgi:hypothetical protein
VWVLVNHFKSQSGGGGAKRARQAQGVRTIAEDLVAAGERHIVVMGDLNEGPPVLGQPAANLASLVDPNGPLVEVYALPTFDPGPRPGTFQSCGIRNRLDYILVSHDLAGLVIGGGIERRGLWGTPTNVNPPAQWDIYPRSPARIRQPPTTPPSTSTSTSDQSLRRVGAPSLNESSASTGTASLRTVGHTACRRHRRLSEGHYRSKSAGRWIQVDRHANESPHAEVAGTRQRRPCPRPASDQPSPACA